MRILSRRTLREFWALHPDAREPLETWYQRVNREKWPTPAVLLELWPRASIVGQDRAVFRIKGNDYRLVARIFYPGGEVYIRFVGTHAQYDRINVEEV